MRKAQKLVVLALLAAMTVSCSSNSRRAEIDARKAALQHKQDSTLEATKLELARADSILEALNREYAEKEAIVQKHREELTATEQELTELNQLRMRRDSQQVVWQTLGAKIRYINKVKK
jgi:Skp family chaperone for outer membrane proteins